MGDFVISPLLPVLPKDVLTVGSLCSAGATPRLRSYGPIRHPLVFRRFPGSPGYTAYPAPPPFGTGRGGLLQLLSASLSPCRRCLPRRSGPTRESACAVPCCLHPGFTGWAFRASLFRGYVCVRFRCGPVTRSHPSDGIVSISLLPAIQATGLLAVALAGLPPAERASLSLDAQNRPERGFPQTG